VGTLLTLVAVGVAKTFLAHGHPTSLTTLPVPSPRTMSYLSSGLRGNDGRGGGVERRDGVWRAADDECAAHG